MKNVYQEDAHKLSGEFMDILEDFFEDDSWADSKRGEVTYDKLLDVMEFALDYPEFKHHM